MQIFLSACYSTAWLMLGIYIGLHLTDSHNSIWSFTSTSTWSLPFLLAHVWYFLLSIYIVNSNDGLKTHIFCPYISGSSARSLNTKSFLTHLITNLHLYITIFIQQKEKSKSPERHYHYVILLCKCSWSVHKFEMSVIFARRYDSYNT